MLEKELQDRGMFLFQLSHGSYVVDQRSGDGRRSQLDSIDFPKFEMHDAKIASALKKIS